MIMRFTVTLPDALNSRIEERCGEKGTSKNAWIVSALTTAVDRCTIDGTETAPIDHPSVRAMVQGIEAERDRIAADLAAVTAERDRTWTAAAEVSTLKAEIAHRDQVLALKADEISWLRGQVALLSERLAPPALPEKAGGGRRPWWRFWVTSE